MISDADLIDIEVSDLMLAFGRDAFAARSESDNPDVLLAEIYRAMERARRFEEYER